MNEYQKHFVKTRKASSPKSNRDLAELLRGRILQKSKTIKNRKGIPIKLVTFLIVGIIGGYFGLSNVQKIEKYIHGIEVSWLGTAMAEEATKADQTKAKDAKTETSLDAGQKAADKRDFTEDEINHFARMNDRKKELDSREDELNKMEAEMITQKVELEKKINDLDQTRRNIASVLDDRVKADDKKVDSLVQLYSSMKPQQAAKVFENMDEDLAIEILGRMKKKPAAEILNLVKAEKAQLLSEKFAGYKRK